MESIYGSNTNPNINMDDAGTLYASPQVTVKLETMEKKENTSGPKFCTQCGW